MKNKVFYHAFRTQFPGITRELITPAQVRFPKSAGSGNWIDVRALWDTGASGTVITKKIVQSLNLKPFKYQKVYGVNSSEDRPVYLMDMGLPNRVAIPDIQAVECEINSPHVDMIIGMNIIQKGDFAISNANGKTLFSFCIPSHPHPIDLLAKALAINPKK